MKEILESFSFSPSAIGPERAFPLLERSNLISCFSASKLSTPSTIHKKAKGILRAIIV